MVNWSSVWRCSLVVACALVLSAVSFAQDFIAAIITTPNHSHRDPSVPLKVSRFPATADSRGVVIFLHGLGDYGETFRRLGTGWRGAEPWSHYEYLLPYAPLAEVSLLQSRVRVPSWFDMRPAASYNLSDGTNARDLHNSAARVVRLIEDEVAAGTPSERIVLGGFSQGAVVSTLVALTSGLRLGGIATASGFVPPLAGLTPAQSTILRTTPWFVLHGIEDSIIPLHNGEALAKMLIDDYGMTNVEYKAYPGLDHGTTVEEFGNLQSFFARCLPIS